MAGSVIILGWRFYLSKTQLIPRAGGEYIEGIVGQPQHINPVISQSNTTDNDISQLVYSSLLKYNNQGELIPDLAENYEMSEGNTLFTVHLKQNVLWHDGESLNADDVLFTANILNDPAYKSPLRLNWQGVETNIIDDHTISFKTKSPYAGFLNNLTFGILPKHIWESVSPDKFPLTDLNLEPIGSGPYKFNSIQKDSRGNIISYKLVANPNYFDSKPFISKITFNFYPDDDSILKAYNSKEIMGINSIASQKIDGLKLEQSTIIHKFSTPRYFAVFFNQTKSLPLANDEVREALALATDRNEIINQVLRDSGNPVYSPMLPGMIGYSDNIDKKDLNLEKANKILDDNGWARGQDGFRSKSGSPLAFALTTTDWSELVQTAEILKSQWEKIGVKMTINSYSISDVQQNYIRPREYEALLFGQVVGADPDPYSFWHSANKKDPGLNLALFGDSSTDKLIEDSRTEFDTAKRAGIYQEFQKKIANEVPAVFLYSPDYIYPATKNVQGINISSIISPSDRFSEINKWYIKTNRIWK